MFIAGATKMLFSLNSHPRTRSVWGEKAEREGSVCERRKERKKGEKERRESEKEKKEKRENNRGKEERGRKERRREGVKGEGEREKPLKNHINHWQFLPKYSLKLVQKEPRLPIYKGRQRVETGGGREREGGEKMKMMCRMGLTKLNDKGQIFYLIINLSNLHTSLNVFFQNQTTRSRYFIFKCIDIDI